MPVNDLRSLPRRVILLALPAGALGLPGCGSAPDARPSAPAGGAKPPAPDTSPLVAERRWLQQWFAGTPVVIAQQRDGALAVTVPREFCFDPGSHAVKPPLAAVLDKVAESLRRQRQARVDTLAVPADGERDAALLRRRGLAVRDHLRSRGVADARLAAPATTASAGVLLRLQLPSPA